MNTLIDKIAEYILNTDINENICIVFPSKRAGLYLKNSLIKLKNKPVIIPKIFSINEFIEYMANAKIMNKIESIFILFKLYRDMGGNKNFDVFYDLAKIMIKDFSDIDRMLVNEGKIKAIFSNLKEIALLENRDESIKSKEYIKKHIEMMEIMGDLYELMNNYSIKENKCYTGLCYRLAYKNIKNNNIDFSKIIFAGFNALTNIEKKIFEELKNKKKAEFIWESDELINNDYELSGYFIKKNIKEFKSIIEYENKLKEEKNINIISSITNVDQGLVLKEILKKKFKNGLIEEDVGIILMNENVLIPILYSLPDNYKRFNITMGFPANKTPIYEIIRLIMDMHIKKITTQAKGFYTGDMIQLLKHGYIKKILNIDTLKEINKYIDNAVNSGILYVKLPENVKNKVPFIFKDFIDSNKLLDELENLFLNMLDIFKDTSSTDYIIVMYEAIKELKKYFTIIENISVNMAFNIMLSVLNEITIPFTGEPLQGLQIMGLLESRMLAFKHLIILSVNDDFLPGKGNDYSLIPKDVKRHYGIFTNKEKDAIFSYHFFRLLKYAKNVDIIYTEHSDEKTGVMMKSRFIDYILWNNERNQGIGMNWNIKKYIYTNTRLIKSKNKEIKKNQYINEKLYNIEYSTSSIENYLLCPYKFFIEKVLKIYIEDEYETNMDRGKFGTLLHNVFEKLYNNYKEKIYDIVNDNEWNKHYMNIISEIIEDNKELSRFQIDSGENKLLIDIGKILIKNMILKERQIRSGIDFSISWKFEYNPNKNKKIYLELDKKRKVSLKGYIDRLELYNDKAIIVDYKTGNVNSTKLKILDDFEEQKQEIIKKKEAFQLLFYIYMLNKTEFKRDYYEAYIYSVSKGKIEKLTFNNEDKISQEKILKFESMLINIIDEILDENNDFVSLEKIDKSYYGKCKYCKFDSVCRSKD